MKKGRFLFLLTIPILLGSCVTSNWKETLVSSGNINSAIENVITDFVHTSSLIKTDSVFEIQITDTNADILMIGIVRPSDIIRPSFKNKVGTYDDVFLTKYLIKEDRLFYWSDSTQVITQDILDVLKQYDHIDFSWVKLPYEMIHGVHNDGEEGSVYYICKNDYSNYKKTGISNISKRYKQPVLRCSKQ